MSDSDDAAQDPRQVIKAIAIRNLYTRIAMFERRVAVFERHVAQRRDGLLLDLRSSQDDELSLDLLSQIQSELNYFMEPYSTSPGQHSRPQRDRPGTGDDEKDEGETRGRNPPPPAGGPADKSTLSCPHCGEPVKVTLTKG